MTRFGTPRIVWMAALALAAGLPAAAASAPPAAAATSYTIVANAYDTATFQTHALLLTPN